MSKAKSVQCSQCGRGIALGSVITEGCGGCLEACVAVGLDPNLLDEPFKSQWERIQQEKAQ